MKTSSNMPRPFPLSMRRTVTCHSVSDTRRYSHDDRPGYVRSRCAQKARGSKSVENAKVWPTLSVSNSANTCDARSPNGKPRKSTVRIIWPYYPYMTGALPSGRTDASLPVSNTGIMIMIASVSLVILFEWPSATIKRYDIMINSCERLAKLHGLDVWKVDISGSIGENQSEH